MINNHGALQSFKLQNTINSNHKITFPISITSQFPGFISPILFLIISFNVSPSCSKLLIPADNKSVAILLLFISYLNIDSSKYTSSMSRLFACSAFSFTGTSALPFFSSYNNFGLIVSLSHPHNSFISPVLRNDAPITIVFMSNFLKQLQISLTDTTPGSSCDAYSVFPLSFLFQSKILPTNGEIKKSLLLAQAIAWILWKTSVMLHLILLFSKASPALIPSQVEAILINTLLVSTPLSSYKLMILLARLMVSFLSKDSLASTYVETQPLTFSRIFLPKLTNKWSQTSSISYSCWFAYNSSQFAGFISFFFFPPWQLSKFFNENSIDSSMSFEKVGFFAA